MKGGFSVDDCDRLRGLFVGRSLFRGIFQKFDSWDFSE